MSTRPDTTFWILTSLASGPSHGYGILSAVADASNGRVELKTASLYSALERLEAGGEIAVDRHEIVDGRARRSYRLTDAGRAHLEALTADLERSARAARSALSASIPRPVTARAAAV